MTRKDITSCQTSDSCRTQEEEVMKVEKANASTHASLRKKVSALLMRYLPPQIT